MKLTKAEEFSVRIKRLDMRHSQVAEKVGMSPSSFSLILNGHLPFTKEFQERVDTFLFTLEHRKGV